MHEHPPGFRTVEAALAEAERKGFRLAVIGRTCALVAVAFFYLEAFGYPNNVFAAACILFTAALGLVPLGFVGGRYERAARYALFTLDAVSASAIVALAPLSSGGDIPQNLVFHSSRNEYFYAIVALSFLRYRRLWSSGPGPASSPALPSQPRGSWPAWSAS